MKQQSDTTQGEKGNQPLPGNLHLDLRPAARAAVELESHPEVLRGNRSHRREEAGADDSEQAQFDWTTSRMQHGFKLMDR